MNEKKNVFTKIEQHEEKIKRYQEEAKLKQKESEIHYKFEAYRVKNPFRGI